MNLQPSKVGDLPVANAAESEKTVKQEVIVGCRQKQAVSLDASGPIRLQEHSKIDHHIDASEKSKLSLEKEHLLSSSGSMPLKPSLAESHVPTQNAKKYAASSKESGGMNRNNSAEDSKFNKAKFKDCCRLKVIMNSFQIIGMYFEIV